MRENLTNAQAIGLAIKSARNYRDVNGTELARLISEQLGETYSPQTISRMEKGHREPTISELQAIAEALAWPFQWLAKPPFPTGLDLTQPGGYLAPAA